MEKKLTILSFLFLCFAKIALCAGGIYDSFAIVDGTFYDLDATTMNLDFEGANLGTFGTGDQLLLGGQLKSFKNNGTDVEGASIFYVIYESGNRPMSPTFTEISYAFQWNEGDTGAPAGLNNSGDQQWGTEVGGANTTDLAVDIFDGVSLPAGNYVLEVYARITTNGMDAPAEIFDSNGGSNYKANFTLDTPLPVTLTQFTATPKGSTTHLQWSTATELNNDGFEVQRSADARRWSVLGWVTGRGTTQEQQDYTFTDEAPLPGQSYYRLKQIDYDGQHEYSPVVSVRLGDSGQFEVFPNPVRERLRLSFTATPPPDARLRLRNARGQTVREWPADTRGGLSLQGVRPGAYVLQLEDTRGALLHAERVMVQ